MEALCGGSDAALDRTTPVILHMDLDCFYCQVEHKRLSIATEIPLGVQQWHSLIAVNYAARRLGISTSMTAADAKQKVPNIRLIHTAVIDRDSGKCENIAEEPGDKPIDWSANRQKYKACLMRYRGACYQVMSIIQRFVSLKYVERASIDEVYIDATELVNNRQNTARWEDYELEKCLNSTVVVGGCKLTRSDFRLVLAAEIVSEMRTAIFEETGFTISAGISENKLLSKIASAQNKPNKQTLVPPIAAREFVRNCKLKSIPGLGGKLGDSLISLWLKSSTNKTEEVPLLGNVVGNIPLEALAQNFGPPEMKKIIDTAEGICHQAILPKMAPKSLLSAKSFRKPVGFDMLKNWLRVLLCELFYRSKIDAFMFGRIATRMVVFWSGVGSGNKWTKRIPVPNPNPFLSYVVTGDSVETVEELFIVEPDLPSEEAINRLVSHCLLQAHFPADVETQQLSLQLISFEYGVGGLSGLFSANSETSQTTPRLEDYFAKANTSAKSKHLDTSGNEARLESLQSFTDQSKTREEGRFHIKKSEHPPKAARDFFRRVTDSSVEQEKKKPKTEPNELMKQASSNAFNRMIIASLESKKRTKRPKK